MGLFNSPSKVDRVIDSVESHPLLKSAAMTAVESAFAAGMAARKDAGGTSSRSRSRSPLRKAGKPALVVAAGVAGLAAASAAVSSLRQRQDD